MEKRPLTAERLREYMRYDPETGHFTRRFRQRGGRKPADGIAGCWRELPGGPRRVITVDGRAWYGYRLAVLYMTGSWPEAEVDHIDGNPSNDAWRNLRQCSHAINMQNRRKAHSQSTTGVLGVSVNADGKFWARIQVDGRSKYLGTFDDVDAASAAFLTAKRQLHAGCTL